MDFRESLQNISASVDGVVFATLMGYDGVPVADFHVEPKNGEAPIDVQSLLVEFSAVLAQMSRSAQAVSAGPLEELSVRSERLTTIIRPVGTEYFLALALTPEANSGKGRYLLRVNAPKILQDLG